MASRKRWRDERAVLKALYTVTRLRCTEGTHSDWVAEACLEALTAGATLDEVAKAGQWGNRSSVHDFLGRYERKKGLRVPA